MSKYPSKGRERASEDRASADKTNADRASDKQKHCQSTRASAKCIVKVGHEFNVSYRSSGAKLNDKILNQDRT